MILMAKQYQRIIVSLSCYFVILFFFEVQQPLFLFLFCIFIISIWFFVHSAVFSL